MDRRKYLATIAGTTTIFIAGCTNTDTGERENNVNGERENTGGPTVSVLSTDEYGDILVGPDKMSLYLFEKDTKGSKKSSCYDDCANAWPPLTVSREPSKGDKVASSLSTFEREDGSKQVAINGWPLYYYVSDKESGDTKGQEVEGFGGEWYLIGPNGKKIEGEEEHEKEEEKHEEEYMEKNNKTNTTDTKTNTTNTSGYGY